MREIMKQFLSFCTTARVPLLAYPAQPAGCPFGPGSKEYSRYLIDDGWRKTGVMLDGLERVLTGRWCIKGLRIWQRWTMRQQEKEPRKKIKISMYDTHYCFFLIGLTRRMLLQFPITQHVSATSEARGYHNLSQANQQSQQETTTANMRHLCDDFRSCGSTE